jgi:hypothetical protein
MEFASEIPGYVVAVSGIILLVVLGSGVLSWVVGQGKSRWLGVGITGVVFLVMVYLFIITPLQTKVVVDTGVMQVKVPPFAHRQVDSGDVVKAYVVDLSQAKELQPVARTGGGDMGNYKIGRFTLRNGQPAVLMIAGYQVLCIELKEEYLLLAPKHFDRFVKEVDDKLVPVATKTDY